MNDEGHRWIPELLTSMRGDSKAERARGWPRPTGTVRIGAPRAQQEGLALPVESAG